ncbi:MAG: hypothetical protein U9R77_13770 [Pseudomonadota bacterium]|nr:hypothetical protein [Pseudomonadota bacterium]
MRVVLIRGERHMQVQRILGGVILCLGSILMSACAGAGGARVEPVTMAVYPDRDGCRTLREPDVHAGKPKPTAADSRPGAIDLSCFTFPGSGQTAYVTAAGSDTARNRLAAVLLKQADDVCTSEKALLLKRQAEVNGWMSILTTGLSTTSTIVSGDLAKSILSGGAAITSGSRDHVNTHVYRNQIIQTITKAIDTERTRLHDLIVPHLKQDITTYNVDEMIREVNAYHQACSFGTGLQIVMDSVEKREAFNRAAQVQSINDELRALETDRRTGIAGAGTDARIETLLDERMRLATGVSVD